MSYNPSIPGPNDLLSQSQGQIQTNFSVMSTWSAVDHVGLTTPTNTGQHSQVTLPAFVTPSVPTASASVVYSANNGSSIANLIFQNSQSNFLLSCVKAWGKVSDTGSFQYGYNIASTSAFAGQQGQYVINLTNALPNTSYIVLATSFGQVIGGAMVIGGLMTYEIVSTSQFRIYAKSISNNQSTVNVDFGFVVIQL